MVHALPTTKSHRDLVRLGCSQQSCKLSLMALLPCGCLSFGNSAFLLTSAVIVATSGLHMNGKVLCSSTVTTLTSAIKNPGVDHHHDVRLSRGDMSARIPSLGELEGDREPGPVLVTRRDPSVLLSESRACLQIAVRASASAAVAVNPAIFPVCGVCCQHGCVVVELPVQLKQADRASAPGRGLDRSR